MAYATEDDVLAILPASEADNVADNADRLEVNLEEATDLVIAYLDREFEADDVPDAVRRVVARVALRGFVDEPANPGAESEVQLMGPFSYTINWSKEAQARDFYLTAAEKMRLDRFKLYPATGAAHIPMAGSGWDWYA